MRFLPIIAILWSGAVSAQAPDEAFKTAQRAATKVYVANTMNLRNELAAMRGELEVLRGMIGMVQDVTQKGPLMHQVHLVSQRLNRMESLGLFSVPASGVGAAKPKPFSSAALSRLENSLRSANFREDKVRVIREAAKLHFFSTRQVRTIVGHLSFGADRVEAIAAIYPRLTDPENAHGLYELLSSRSDRESLEKRLNP